MKLFVVTVVALALAPIAAVAQEPTAAGAEVTQPSTVAQRSAARRRAFHAAREARDARMRFLSLTRKLTDLTLESVRHGPWTAAYVRRQIL